MNSALKPVLTQGAPQNPPGSAQVNKPMHPQGAQATTYSQPPAHIPQNLVNIPPANAHSSNFYSLNVPNAPQHYIGGNAPASNHPAPVSQPSAGQQMYSPSKSTTYTGGYQSNLGHSPNVLPPVSQSLPPSQPQQQQQSQTTAESSPEKLQANGTPEAKSPTKVESKTPAAKVEPQQQQNHVAAKEKQSPEKEKAEVKDKAVASAPQVAGSVVKPSVGSSTSAAATTAVSTNNTTTIAQEHQLTKVESSPQAATLSTGQQSKPKEQSPQVQQSPQLPQPQQPKPSSTLKLATTTPRLQNRKQKPSPTKPEAAEPAKAKSEPKQSSSPQKSSPPATPSTIGKSKRARIQTQPYQSPLPELEILSKMTSSSTPKNRSDEKLIVFYKNEFIAVRNSEGSFYVCQAVQNIYKTSQKIKIRWLSQDKSDKTGEIYTPDFYDHTDFDCILTNLNLSRVEKGKFRLPPAEKERTDSILKRALAVEKGDATPPSLTEEHPDGLDLSLYKEESQLKKRRAKKRKASSPIKSDLKSKSTKKSPDASKVRKVAPKPAKAKPVSVKAKSRAVRQQQKMAATAEAKSRAERAAKRRVVAEPVAVKSSPVVDQKKAKVLAKVARKGAKSQATAKNTKASKTAAPLPKVQKPTPGKSQSVTRKNKRSTRK